jgi:hypothetical protein
MDQASRKGLPVQDVSIFAFVARYIGDFMLQCNRKDGTRLQQG